MQTTKAEISYESGLNRKQLNIPPVAESNKNGSSRLTTPRNSIHTFSTTAQRSPLAVSSIIKQRYPTSQQQIVEEEEEVNDDDLDNELELNGNTNESASESGESSAANRAVLTRSSVMKRPQSSIGRFNTSLLRDEEIEPQRRLSGLYSTSGSKHARICSDSTGGLNFATHLQTHKSLFSDKNMPNSLNNSTTSLTSLNRRQSFNASIYGSTSALSDSRLLNTNSPFYNGRTIYGGASAYSRRASSMQRTIRVPTQIRPSSGLSGISTATSTNSLGANSDIPTSGLSNTAKRILDLMNQFTTPLADVKKMANTNSQMHIPALVAHRKRFDDSDIIANRSIRMQSPQTPYNRITGNSSSCSRKTATFPIVTNELQVPSMSQLLQMKKLLQNNTEKVRELATGSKSILNKEEVYKLPQQNDTTVDKSDAKLKIRNKITSTRASSNQPKRDEPVEQVNLPNIQFKLKNVPVIDIDISIPKSNTSTSSITTPSATWKTSIASINSSTTGMDNAAAPLKYTFSSPIEIGVTSSFAKNVKPISNFKFSEPIHVNNQSLSSSSSSLTLNPVKTQSAFTAKDKSPSMQKSVVPELKTGSVLDALKIPPTTAVPKSSATSTSTILFSATPTATAAVSSPLPTLSTLFKQKTDQWECDSCMLKNENSKLKCVACEAPKQTVKKALTQIPTITANTFGEQFKHNSSTWECSTCLIRNNSDVSKCVACESLNPSIKAAIPTSSSLATTLDKGFKTIASQQSAKWECTACMARNDALRKKCECCELEKPGTNTGPSFSFGSSSSAAASVTPKFSFGVPFNEKLATAPVAAAFDADKKTTSFSFGVKPSESTTVTSLASTSKITGIKPTISFGTPQLAAIDNTLKKDESCKFFFFFLQLLQLN